MGLKGGFYRLSDFATGKQKTLYRAIQDVSVALANRLDMFREGKVEAKLVTNKTTQGRYEFSVGYKPVEIEINQMGPDRNILLIRRKNTLVRIPIPETVTSLEVSCHDRTIEYLVQDQLENNPIIRENGFSINAA